MGWKPFKSCLYLSLCFYLFPAFKNMAIIRLIIIQRVLAYLEPLCNVNFWKLKNINNFYILFFPAFKNMAIIRLISMNDKKYEFGDEHEYQQLQSGSNSSSERNSYVSSVRPWDVRFLGKEKTRAAQNSCNFCYLIGWRQDDQKTVLLKVFTT